MIRLVRIVILAAALSLGLAPLAPVSAQCISQDHMNSSSGEPVIAAGATDMPCCPDGFPATSMGCKTACPQLQGMTLAAPLPTVRLESLVFADLPAAFVSWLTPPVTEPPRPSLGI